MSLAQTGSTWLRSTFALSNSPRDWLERGIGIFLFALAASLIYFTPSLSLTTGIVLWGLFAAAAFVILHVAKVSVFGPVLFYDMVRTARQSRYAILRMLYAGLLLVVLFWTYFGTMWRGQEAREAAIIASTYFEIFIVVQLVMVTLLTPAYVAGSVAEEKERRTLEFMLATDLRNREIILSKLGSRLGNMLMLLLTGLPILSFLQFLGGVDPNLVFMGFAATGLTTLGIGCISILHSVLLKKPRDAIALTYLFMIAYVALATFLYALASSPGVMSEPLWFGASFTYGDLIYWPSIILNAGNPLAVLIEISGGGRMGTLATTLPPLLFQYAVFYAGLSTLCLVWATVRLRTIALQEAFGKTIKLKAHQHYRPAVGALPMVWKELVIEGSLKLNWLAWGVVTILVLLTLGVGLFMIALFGWGVLTRQQNFIWRDLSEGMNIWVRFAGTSVACLTLLWVAVRASTSIGIERDKQTFDALITSPLSADEMLSAKLLGSIAGCRLGLIWLGAILSLALLTGGIHFLAVPIVLGAWLIYACCFAMLGLWFSMMSKNSLRATVYTIMGVLAVSVGHWLIWMCCGPIAMFMDGHGNGRLFEYIAKFQAGNTPPFVLAFVMYSYDDVRRSGFSNEFGEFMVFSLFGICLWGAAAAVGWFAILSPAFRKLTRRDTGFSP